MAFRHSRGFTLIELLVTMAIIGILAAIAIPQVMEYRRRGFDARANADLRNAATAEEAVYATDEAYVQCAGTSCNHPTLPGFHMSDRVQIVMLRFSIFGGTQNFLGLSWSTSGTGRFFVWRSDEGGML